MNSFRSKPLGWRYESARHGLAARGIESKGYFSYNFPNSKVYVPVAKNIPKPFEERKEFWEKRLMDAEREIMSGNKEWLVASEEAQRRLDVMREQEILRRNVKNEMNSELGVHATDTERRRFMMDYLKDVLDEEGLKGTRYKLVEKGFYAKKYFTKLKDAKYVTLYHGTQQEL